MPAVLDAEINATERVRKGVPPQLAPYVFKRGQPAPRGAGRPKGSRNAADIYLESLPLKARQWVKSTDARILSEARQLVAKTTPELSLSSDVMATAPTTIVAIAYHDPSLMLVPASEPARVSPSVPLDALPAPTRVEA